MSLEAATNALTEATKSLNATNSALTEIMTKHNELLSGLASKVPAKADTAASAVTSNAATETTVKETAAQKKAREKAAADAARAEAEKNTVEETPAITVETLKASVAAFFGTSAKGSQEGEAKKAAIKRILAKMGTERVTELSADQLAEFKGYFDSVVNGEDPFSDEASSGEDDLL